jgi:nucleotide-binding universal stress UspA family protein
MAVLHPVPEIAEASGATGLSSLVVALDLVEDVGDRALPIVRSLAHLGNIAIELLTVSSPNLDEDVDAYELERRRHALDWPATTSTILHDENPAAAIAAHVAERPDSLLVMASSAKRTLTGLFLGGVSEEVLTLVDRPVLLAGPRVGPASHAMRPTLVACVDESGIDAPAVSAITKWLHTFRGGNPWIVEVVAPGDGPTTGSESSNVRRVAQLLADHGIPASWDVLHGNEPDVALIEFGKRLCDPIFVAMSVRWTDGRLHWRSTTRKLVQRSTLPVLVIPVREP